MNKEPANDDLRMVPLCHAAEMIGVSARTMQRMVNSGALPAVRTSTKSNGARWVSIAALRHFVNSGGVPSAVNKVYC